MSYGRQPRHVVVVGSGISGLTAAYLVGQAGRGAVRVTVVEKGPVVGGHLRVAEVAGLPIDEGAESLLNRRPEAVELAHAAGLGDDLEHPVTVAAGLWSRGAVVPLPATTLLGVPSVPADLAQILDPDDVARVAAEPTVPGSPCLTTTSPSGPSSRTEWVPRSRSGWSIHSSAASTPAGPTSCRFGRRCPTWPLRLPARVPCCEPRHQCGRSRRFRRPGVRRHSRRRRPAACCGRGGLRRGDPNRHHRSESVGQRAAAAAGAVGAVWRVEIGPAPAPEFLDADAVIVAVPATPAARMLADVAPAAAAELAAVEYASVAIVTLAMPVNAFPERPSWSGYLVPPIDGHVTTAVTFSSVKWGWLGKAADDLVVLRASIGRHRDQANLQHEDGELVDTVLAELGQAVGVAGKPVDARVSRWGGALPQYAVGHVERVARVRAAVEANPGLAVCGAVYDGVGVAACVASARRAVDHVLPSLGLVPGSRA